MTRHRQTTLLRSLKAACVLFSASLLASPASFGIAAAADYGQAPMLSEKVDAGQLPPLAERLPKTPLQVEFDEEFQTPGQYGGDLKMLIGRAQDVKLMMVYGYARLVRYTPDLELEPDILEAVEVTDGRLFTLRLREGHKWSDGHPFTSEDFRYWWEDVANAEKLSPAGPPASLLVDGEAPKVSFPDDVTVRYEWSKPNPTFLPALAGAAPLLIYRPAHYLKKFHGKYADRSKMTPMQKIKFRSWAAQHNRLDNLYKFNNPDLPTLQPWMNATRPPANRFIGNRNPYFHRVDPQGRQLPYMDRLVFSVAAPKLIPAKTAAGEVTLQARYLPLNAATVLRENEHRSGYRTMLWRTVKGAQVALYPNLNINDPVWRDLFRDVRFRRALSLAIDREEINQALYFGMAIEGNNTVQPDSPLYDETFTSLWATYDPEAANKLLDEIGLTGRNRKGLRLLPDGRPVQIIIETAGEDTEQTDILQLIEESWRDVGIDLFTKPSQREVFRNRIYAGATMMSVWGGLENGIPTPAMSPAILAPTSQTSYQWPKWGQYHETKGQSGDAPDMAEAVELAGLYKSWLAATDDDRREEIWRRMLRIHAEQQFTIGIVSGVLQPVVMANNLRNLPEEGIYNWNPGAHFGLYQPDSFWLEGKK